MLESTEFQQKNRNVRANQSKDMLPFTLTLRVTADIVFLVKYKDYEEIVFLPPDVTVLVCLITVSAELL